MRCSSTLFADADDFNKSTFYINIAADYSNQSSQNAVTDFISAASVWMFDSTQYSDLSIFYERSGKSEPSFPLQRNVHLRGTVTLGVRQIMKSTWKGVLGLGAVSIIGSCRYFDLIICRTTKRSIPIP